MKKRGIFQVKATMAKIDESERYHAIRAAAAALCRASGTVCVLALAYQEKLNSSVIYRALATGNDFERVRDLRWRLIDGGQPC